MRASWFNPFGGVKVYESAEALAYPDAKPFTDDMREMVNHLFELGLATKKPAAFMAGGRLYAHPAIIQELRKLPLARGYQ